MKIAVVIGHHKKSKGALSKYFGLREFDFYKEVCECLHDVDIYTHDSNISGYVTRIKNTASILNKKNYDLVIELHFNAFNGRANGCETLYYYGSRKGREYSKKFSELVGKRTGIKLRHEGLKALSNRNDRGFASVYYTNAPTILIEPFFGDNENDCKKIYSAEYLSVIINEFITIIK